MLILMHFFLILYPLLENFTTRIAITPLYSTPKIACHVNRSRDQSFNKIITCYVIASLNLIIYLCIWLIFQWEHPRPLFATNRLHWNHQKTNWTYRWISQFENCSKISRIPCHQHCHKPLRLLEKIRNKWNKFVILLHNLFTGYFMAKWQISDTY